MDREQVAVVMAGGRGTRFRTTGPWSKHLEPLEARGMRRPLLGWVLDAVVPHWRDVMVVVGHRGDETEAFVRDTCPAARTVRQGDVEIEDAVALAIDAVRPAVAVVFLADIVVAPATVAAYAGAVAGAPDLVLLVGRKPASDREWTLELAGSRVIGVRRSVPDDGYRWSVVSAVVPPDLWDLAHRDGRALHEEMPIWHGLAHAVLAAGRNVTYVVSEDAGVNVNRAHDLLAASAHLSRTWDA